MGLGHCFNRATERSSAKILIQPFSVKMLASNYESNRLWKQSKQEETQGGATKSNAYWSDEDLEKLYSLDHLPSQEVAKILGRSYWSIRHKRRQEYREKWQQRS
jgi:hypothetical protein